MFVKPQIISVPHIASPMASENLAQACDYYNGNWDFECSPYNDDCIDATYDDGGCDWTLAIGGIGTVATVGVTILAT